VEATIGPTFSRRQVLGGAGALAAAGLAPAVLGNLPRLQHQQLSWAAEGPAVADLSLGRFTPHVGTEFVVRATGGTRRVRIALVEATARLPHPLDRQGLSGEAFSLVFAARGAEAFGPGIRTVVHPVLGAFPLFLVPVGRATQGQRYQAVVDRRTLAR
jgi:hypothetical protein